MDKKELTKLVSYFIMGDGGAYIKDSFSYKIRMLDPFNKGGDIV